MLTALANTSKIAVAWEFPEGPLQWPGSTPGWETKIPQWSWHGQKKD